MFGINKNGTKHKVGIILPAFFPSNRVTYDNTSSGLTSTDVQDAIDELAQGGGGGGGHTIWNAIKTALTQRTKLWFADAKVTDDSTEQATKVEVVQLIDDEDELDDAPDGLYQGDYDEMAEGILDASVVAYGEGTVEDALDELIAPTFTEASTRTNIVSGETISTLFGKIKKWFTDLATVAFTGAYSDLTGTPTIPPDNSVKDYNNNTQTKFGYSTSGMAQSDATWLGGWDASVSGEYRLRAVKQADLKVAYATSAGSAAPTAGSTNYVRVYSGSSTYTLNDLAKQYFSMGMINPATDNPNGKASWVHAINMSWVDNNNTQWTSQIAIGVNVGKNMWYRTNSGTIVGRGWVRVIDTNDNPIVNITRSGTTFTATRASGSTFTFTQQDTNTTYSANNGVGLSGTTFYNTGVRSVTQYVSNPPNGSYIQFNVNGSNTNITPYWADIAGKLVNGKASIEVQGASLATRLVLQNDYNLVLYKNGGAVWATNTSSRRFKHNIQSMTEERAKKILQIRPVTFDWNDGQPVTTQKCDNAGVIAEEVSQVIPDVVVFEQYDNDPNTRIERRVEYERFTPYLIKMVQIQQKQIDTMQATINALERRLSILEAK